MVDNLSSAERSERMSRIGGKHTAPEMIVRRMAHALGYRFRLHRKDLPGSPDLVFPRLRKIVFVHGCFWHGHGCKIGQLPKSNVEFWAAKIARNRERDSQNWKDICRLSWEPKTIWQCQTRDTDTLRMELERFLGTRARTRSTRAKRGDKVKK